ncbi:MAG: ribokinase [Sphingomonas sp.]|nr:ribokinase [Sphingomonas sp.]
MTIFVHGSINLDIIARVERLPESGETVLALDTARLPGGKGANQAIAAASCGAKVEMSGLVGDDADGRFMIDRLRAAGVGVTGIGVHETAPTGTALIAVDRESENFIIVASGANAHVTAPAAAPAGLLLVQAEIPLGPLAQAMRAATGMVVFNAAPAIAGADALFPFCEIVIVNQAELAAFANKAQDGAATDEERARALLCRPGQSIVVTLGRDGALVIDASGAFHFPGHQVETIDTTGAGDCFCGAFAARLDQGFAIGSAARFANAAAALSTTRHGAGPSMPRTEEVVDFLQNLKTNREADHDAT